MDLPTNSMSVAQLQTNGDMMLPIPDQGPMLFEMFTTVNSNGQRTVRTRQVPVTTDDVNFAQMMEVPPPIRPRMQAMPDIQGPQEVRQGVRDFLNAAARGMAQGQPAQGGIGIGGAFRFQGPIVQGGPVQVGEWVPMNFGMPAFQGNVDFGVPMPLGFGGQMTGANGPNNTPPALGDPMANRVEAFNRVVEAVMGIYPELGEGNNAQNVTREQSDIIKGILSEANFPISRRMRNLVLREVILRTVVKTPLSPEELAQLETKKFEELPADKKVDAKCAICITEFEDEETVRIMQCGHFYHQDCIDPYLAKYNNKCPMCRENQTGYTDDEVIEDLN